MPRTPRIAVLLMDGMWTHDVANVIQVFGNGTPLRGSATCELDLVAVGESVALDHGLSACTEPLSRYVKKPDLVCVPGFVDPVTDLEAQPAELAAAADWVARAHAGGAQVASLGSGTFVLASAGVLKDVECTVHHSFFDEFRAMFPRVRLSAHKILTHDAGRRVWTSAGGASGLDLCLSLLADLAGPSAAGACAEAMNLWRPHSVGASVEAFGMPGAEAAAERTADIDEICRAVLGDLSCPWNVAMLARASGMSRRTFERHFVEATGETPKTWLSTQRFDMACAFLAQTDLPMPVVAARVGLSSADVLYRLFMARRGESPTAYRRRFSSF